MKNQLSKGDQFNNWTVLSFSGRNEKCEQHYKCQCICGTIREVRRSNLGKVMGCGCVRRTYKERKANPSIPKNIKVKNAEVTPKASQVKKKKTVKKVNTTNKPTNILIDRKLEEIRLAKEIQSQFSLTNY
ncbi:hypothetical protein Q4489_04245 [Thalassotalea sp. 1_MG-2023]|uniref:hypothetical protein n=1 Tax=Thalassotalea sp. 1_MG-2023 TaxID=3062680 RepID=UPI0026E4367A|nr:hypothetical protein [Thalassotalea sp. 1_MG-2023]MDO6426207.1 hypothetical protein [Thalassotalea sp. 1_MG-2023]